MSKFVITRKCGNYAGEVDHYEFYTGSNWSEERPDAWEFKTRREAENCFANYQKRGHHFELADIVKED